MILNLVGIYLAYYTIRLVYLLCLEIYVLLSCGLFGCVKRRDNLKQKLIWGELIKLCLEGTIELLIATYFTLSAGLKTPSGEGISYCIAIFLMFSFFLLIPYSFRHIMSYDTKIIERKDFQ